MANGQILDPDGAHFIPRGLNVLDSQAGNLAAVLSAFGALQMIRVPACSGALGPTCYFVSSPDSVASLTPLVQAATAKGIVVELEDHSECVSCYPNLPDSSQLTAELAWYASLAAAFKDNPYVWFGTMNEPNSGDWAGLASQEQQIYQAIRDAGNDTIVMLELRGGSSADFAQSNPSYFSGMTNVVWDMHFYGNGGNSPAEDQAGFQGTSCPTGVACGLDNVQAVTSADGTVPVLVGEYGVSNSGQGTSPNYNNVIATAQQYGWAQTSIGCLAWEYSELYDSDTLAKPDGSLTPWGTELATFLSTGQSVAF